MASFATLVECLTDVWNCIHDAIAASPWVALFIALVAYISLVFSETLNAGMSFVLRNTIKVVKLLLCKKTLNALLCIFSVCLLLLGLYLTVNSPKVGYVVSIVGMFLTYITVLHVFSDIRKVNKMAEIGFQCVMSTRYYAFYLMTDPELRVTGLDLFVIGFFVQSLQFRLTQLAKENERKENERKENERKENERKENERKENERKENERKENERKENEEKELGDFTG